MKSKNQYNIYPFELHYGDEDFECNKSFENNENNDKNDKNATIKTFLHWTDHNADKILTVFGRTNPGLFYNYEDRLYGEDWFEGLRIAALQTKTDTAKFYEIALNHFHHSTNVDIKHIQLGCNRTTGNSYLIFGYTGGE